MPNWTQNEITISSHSSEHIKEIKDIFEKGCPFGQLIEEPNWITIPLSKNNHKMVGEKLGEKGELPIIEEIKLSDGEVMKSLKFKSTNAQDTRWYDWRYEKWGTKWDVPKDEIEITDIDDLSGRTLVVGFYTAWSAPYGIYRELFNKFSDVSIEWWARDEDDQTDGEGYYLQ